VQLAGLAAADPPPLPEPAVVVVFAADHGVHAQGVSPWPQEVTAQMVANLAAGGAVVNALAAQTGAASSSSTSAWPPSAGDRRRARPQGPRRARPTSAPARR
jgi:transposase-like protein